MDSVPSLKVDLEDVSVTPAEAEDEFPQYGESRRRPAKPAARGLSLSVSVNL